VIRTYGKRALGAIHGAATGLVCCWILEDDLATDHGQHDVRLADLLRRDARDVGVDHPASTSKDTTNSTSSDLRITRSSGLRIAYPAIAGRCIAGRRQQRPGCCVTTAAI